MTNEPVTIALTATVIVLAVTAVATYARALHYATRHIDDLHTRLRNAEHAANHDDLTNLPNRRATLHHLATAVTTTTPTSIAFVDVNQFKAINDTYGHDAG